MEGNEITYTIPRQGTPVATEQEEHSENSDHLENGKPTHLDDIHIAFNYQNSSPPTMIGLQDNRAAITHQGVKKLNLDMEKQQ